MIEKFNKYFNFQTKTLHVDELHCKNTTQEELLKLNVIEHITGTLIIESANLKHISTFNHLKSVNTIIIQNMQYLESITGFNALETLSKLLIKNNSNLQEIYGFNKLFFTSPTISSSIKIEYNKKLTSINFLRGLKAVNSSLYLHHNALTSLAGLENLEYINGSLSLSSNQLSSLKELSNLKHIDGMFGAVNNKLKNLKGLESLHFIRTVNWNNKKRTIALYDNPELDDISALSNIVVKNKTLVLLCDDYNKITRKPDDNSTFYTHDVQIRNIATNTALFLSDTSPFIDIKKITSTNTNTNKHHKLNNLITGYGIGFDAYPPYGSISNKYWSTKKVPVKYKHYFEQHEPIIIELHLDSVQSFDSIGIYSSKVNFANSLNKFTLEFKDTTKDGKFSQAITKTAYSRNPFDIEIFDFKVQQADTIRLTILSNHHKLKTAGRCVDFQEITIIKNAQRVKSDIEASKSTVFTNDLIQPLLQNQLSPEEYFALTIKPEFSLDHIWHPNMTYKEFIEARGLGGIGTQLKRISLSKLGDKIYMHHFLKEHGIKGMPIKLYSNRLDDNFMEQVKILYKNGLNSFVLKVTHLGDSIGIYRVKNGLHITANETWNKNQMYGKKIDFYYLENEIKKHWNNQQYHEDWVSNMIPPGVLLEELLEDPTEIKFSVVFGKVVGFFIREKKFPSFDAQGRALKDKSVKLPFWWKDALKQAEKLAHIIKGDHLRIDFLYNDGEVIVCEVNFNGGERVENYEDIAKELNHGYALRKAHITRNQNES